MNSKIEEQYIKIAANSIGVLRKVDVFRVLDSVRADNIDGMTRTDLASFIVKQRPDLVDEVEEVMQQEFPGDHWSIDGLAAHTLPSQQVVLVVDYVNPEMDAKDLSNLATWAQGCLGRSFHVKVTAHASAEPPQCIDNVRKELASLVEMHANGENAVFRPELSGYAGQAAAKVLLENWGQALLEDPSGEKVGNLVGDVDDTIAALKVFRDRATSILPERFCTDPSWKAPEPAVTIESGCDEESQLSSFQNGTLQRFGKRLAVTVQANVLVPHELADCSEHEAEAYLRDTLEAASAAASGSLKFCVQIGPNEEFAGELSRRDSHSHSI
ncbi:MULTISPECIES: hypothetical protein [Pandoraea]|uniref:Uncharacterized protein n=2 Tax=Pandoraea TaxID=93217 RepID=A0A5E4XGE5_9BURK|nr:MULTISPECIES: hypothetical protein [Pandoraea]VVE17495.1 hypothetical protein PCE31107_02972 [Pandoraea cepalis]VVE35302.1 hypothetical protein PTE31013_03893 [Pandoraea terrigena]